jgi:hypothetical protein
LGVCWVGSMLGDHKTGQQNNNKILKGLSSTIRIILFYIVLCAFSLLSCFGSWGFFVSNDGCNLNTNILVVGASVPLSQLSGVKLGGLQHHHLADEDIVQREDTIALLLNLKNFDQGRKRENEKSEGEKRRKKGVGEAKTEGNKDGGKQRRWEETKTEGNKDGGRNKDGGKQREK